MSDESRDFEIHDFHPDPRTSTEYLVALWQKVNVIDIKVSTINGRVSMIEKFIWALGGALVVVGALVVPQFLGLVK